jgi:hypothetical protein
VLPDKEKPVCQRIALRVCGKTCLLRAVVFLPRTGSATSPRPIPLVAFALIYE